MFFVSKNKDLQGSAVQLFNVFQCFRRSFFGIDFCIDLFMILEAFLAPFFNLFQPFGHHFCILFRDCLFHDFLMPFWTAFGPKSIIHKESQRNPGGIWDLTFSDFFATSAQALIFGSILTVLDKFSVDFGMLFDG